MTMQMGIIGVGNMGEALLAGALKSGMPRADITFMQRSDERANYISKNYGIRRVDIAEIASSDLLLLCVKPKDIADMCMTLKEYLKTGSTIISVAAGKTIEGIQSILGPGVGVIRVMPNTPTFIGKGAAGISYGPSVSEDVKIFVKKLFSASGVAIEVPEDLQAAVTATSGSGPAYFFAFVEAMVAGGIKLGLSEKDATELTIQTIVGAAGMLETSGKSPKELRENVTSPNGTTFAALTSFENSDLAAIVAAAMAASATRSQELA